MTVVGWCLTVQARMAKFSLPVHQGKVWGGYLSSICLPFSIPHYQASHCTLLPSLLPIKIPKLPRLFALCSPLLPASREEEGAIILPLPGTIHQ